MLTPKRSLLLNATAGRELPRLPELDALYSKGVKLRHGQVVMVAGRSGSQKSGFALWLTAQMNVPTIYFSADMSAYTASTRLAGMLTNRSSEQIEAALAKDGPERLAYAESLAKLKMTFSFNSPITWPGIDDTLDAYVEMWNAWPEVMVFDNLMDFSGVESDYAAQMETMSMLTELSRFTGATVFVLHHASDKSWEAKTDPWSPPGREQIKNGLSEKPELTLTVALEPSTFRFNVACVKQRQGPSDPTARSFVSLRCEPDKTRFHKYMQPVWSGAA